MNHPPARCPVCRKTTGRQDNPYFPFCARRCYLVDLGQWAGEKYGIAAAPDPGTEETAGPDLPGKGEKESADLPEAGMRDSTE